MEKTSRIFSDTDGSPLIALKCASIFLDERRVNLRCFLSETNRKRNRILCQNCQDLNNIINADVEFKIYPAQPFSSSLPTIMEELEKYPTLFFLDVFAVKGLFFSDIVNICNYLNKYKGEVFLLFHNRTVARHAGFIDLKSESESMHKAAKTYIKNLTLLLGENSEKEWIKKWLELKDRAQEFERWALEYFKSQLLSKSNIRGVTSFEVKEFYDDTRPQYSIVVCSNYPEKAFGELLNDFIAEENERLFFKESNGKTEPIQSFLENEWNRSIKENSQKIKSVAIELLRKKHHFKTISVKKAITCLILESGEMGVLKKKDYKKIITELYSEKKIEAKELGKTGKLTEDSKIKIV